MTMASTPHFICVGSQKAGTGWVYDQFETHADFVMPPIKELQYFNNRFLGKKQERAQQKLKALEKRPPAKRDVEADRRFLQRVLDVQPQDLDTIDYYRGMFAEFTTKLSGDVCPGYMNIRDKKIRLMASGLPDAKIFAIVRNPIDRAWAQAQMRDRLANRSGDPEPTVTISPQSFEEFLGKRSVSSLSFVAEHLSRFKTVMSDRFRVFFFDDLAGDPDQFRRSLCAFLEVDPNGFAMPADANAKADRPGKRAMPADIRAVARNAFEQEFGDLATLLGGHAIRWAEENAALS